MTEQEVLKEFKDWNITINDQNWCVLTQPHLIIKDSIYRVTINKKIKQYVVTLYNQRNQQTLYSMTTMELHQLLHKLFEIWGWFDEYKKNDATIYYTLVSEIATLMKLKDKLYEINNALKELQYSDNNITCHICLHHPYGRSYVPITEIKKDFVIAKITEEKTLLLNQLNRQLTKVKNLSVIAKLKLSIIEYVEGLLNKEVNNE